jgi:hypothetical protein
MRSESVVRPATLRAIVAIAEAVFSKGGQPPPADRLRFIEHELDDFLSRSGARSRFFFSLMVWLTCALAPLFARRFASFVRLPLADRVHALTALEQRFPEPLLAVKALLCLVYYEHPDAARDVGFDGACALPRSTSAGEEKSMSETAT